MSLPAGTAVEVELVERISSAVNRVGDRFSIRVVTPVVIDGVEVLPAGVMGQGEVIDVAHAGMSGKQGKLIVSARHLDVNGVQMRVRGLTLLAAASGKSRVDLATGVLLVPYAGPAALLIKGGEIEMPAGERATVKLVQDQVFPTETFKNPGGEVQ